MELEPILQELNSSNAEVRICGDYNINLLKFNGEVHFSDFLDMVLGHSFYPKITLPTRLNKSSGATVIDNILCKLSSHTISTCSGIIFDKLSDHLPYFVCLDNLVTRKTKPPKQIKQTMNCPKAMENMLHYIKTNDISCRLNKDLTEDPNKNYNILHDHMKIAKAIHFPVKYINSTSTVIRKIHG